MAQANAAEALVKIICKRGYGGLPTCDPLDALTMILEALEHARTEGAAEERETCAKIAESCAGLLASDAGYLAGLHHVGLAKHIATAIRARAKEGR